MGYRISVIDDSDVFRTVMDTLLTEEGYELDMVPTEAVARERVAAFKPDLIMLDLRMDGEDTGMGLLDTFRHASDFADTPIIVCSGDAAALALHKDDFFREQVKVLEKPFDLDELLRLIEDVLA